MNYQLTVERVSTPNGMVDKSKNCGHEIFPLLDKKMTLNIVCIVALYFMSLS